MGTTVAPTTTQETDALVAPGNPQEPAVRAMARLNHLRSAFGDMVAIVAAMYRDKDWQYLTDDEGVPYNTLAACLADQLGESAAYARRRIQGARDLYLPLSGMVVDGTTINITSEDVRELGKEGAAAAVAAVAEALPSAGNDPAAQTAVVDAAVDNARAQAAADRAARANPPGYPNTDDDGDGDGEDEDYDDGGPVVDPAPASTIGAGSRPTPTPAPTPPAPAPGAGAGDTISRGSSGRALDQLTVALRGCRDDYDTQDAIDKLPDDLQILHGALLDLSDLDPDQLISQINQGNAGVLYYSQHTIQLLQRVRNALSMQPWVIAAQPD